jgi:hypothetical protein
VAVSSRTRRRWQGALRDLILQVCAAGGLAVGLLMGLAQRPSTVDPAQCTTDTCFSEGLLAGVKPMLLYAGGGLFIGVVLGTLLALLVRLDRRAAVATDALVINVDRRWISARYAGTCRRCGASVRPGDSVVHSRAAKDVWCETCGPAQLA